MLKLIHITNNKCNRTILCRPVIPHFSICQIKKACASINSPIYFSIHHLFVDIFSCMIYMCHQEKFLSNYWLLTWFVLNRSLTACKLLSPLLVWSYRGLSNQPSNFIKSPLNKGFTQILRVSASFFWQNFWCRQVLNNPLDIHFHLIEFLG